jgi:glutamine synthetase
MKPDLDTLRLMPWHEGTALVLCDLQWEDGRPVAASPRQILLRQIERLSERGLVPYVGTELEFILFKDGYEAAWDKGYRNLEPANQYNVDYSLIGTGRVEHLLRRIRNDMTDAGMYVESAKGECNLGQHEIAFRYADALTTCDNHSIYKTGAKEIAHSDGMSLTFMAKYDEREGNSCHIHISLRSPDGDPVLAGDGPHGFSLTMERFLAGLLASQKELIAWGEDNRTCAFRVVGHGETLRVENRVAGGDVNPYLAVAALIAAGLHGIENELPLEPVFSGNAYDSDKPRVPANLRDAADLLAHSKLALAAFGPEVVEHYLNAAHVELAAYDATVTDWERFRGFERL